MHGRVLVIAGSDSGGGAGIQADIKAVTAMNGFAMTAITALTAQNTHGVHGVHPVPPDFIASQIRVVLDDLGADAIKTGMLGDAATVSAVVAMLRSHARTVPLVVDPVMVAKGGASLLADSGVAQLRRELLPLAHVLTPNLPEAEALTGLEITDLAAMHRAAQAGRIESWRNTARIGGITIQKRVILGMNENHCVACEAAVREGAIPIEESWSPGFQPPFHPSCYCNMVPVVVKPLTKAAGHTHGLACDAP